ncbi:MAG: twin-arginine translocation pathway signal [Cardiobacteriaceae bacterium]|nr:twin-arginine translocation pathway signal [Cardiobacteriaceae bacterium]
MQRRKLLKLGALTAANISLLSYGYRKHFYTPTPKVNIHYPGLPFGHLTRKKELVEISAKYKCKVLILGSGGAGLSAAWYLKKNNFTDFILAEGFEKNGNNASFNYEDLTAPSAAHYLALPSQESVFVREMLEDLKILEEGKNNKTPTYREIDLVHSPAERLFYKQKWQEGFLPELDKDTVRFFEFINKIKGLYGKDKRKIFSIPIAEMAADNDYLELDDISFKEWLKREKYYSFSLKWYLDYCCRDDYGRGINEISAFAGLHYFAARNNELDSVLTWNGGLSYIAEKLREYIEFVEIKDDILLNNAINKPKSINFAALEVREKEDFVEVVLINPKTQKSILIQAEQVISAMPLMVAKYVINEFYKYAKVGINEELNLPVYSPWLVSNFVLNRFPKEQKNTAMSWDNVIYGSDALGFVYSRHQEIFTAKPKKAILTSYSALNQLPAIEMRKKLKSISKTRLLHIASKDLIKVYGKRFWNCVEYVDIAIRGHAMCSPLPGYLTNQTLINLRNHHSRIFFAHSDLSGYSIFEEANYWGVMAAKKILQNSDNSV